LRSPLTDAHVARYHAKGLLPDNLECFIIDNDFSLVDGNKMVAFEPHLQCGMGFLPSKFLISLCRFYVLELVQLNLNAIAALSIFVILCECWLNSLTKSYRPNS
jgi:hypothetical protein